jgi:hypothetical protein
VEIAALFAPKPLLIVSDGGDWTANTADVEFPYIQKVYATFGAPDKIRNVHLADEGHDYGPSKRAAVYRFFAEHLELDDHSIRDGTGFKENFVTLLPKQSLYVFNATHPLPADALQTDDAVMEYLGIR